MKRTNSGGIKVNKEAKKRAVEQPEKRLWLYFIFFLLFAPFIHEQCWLSNMEQVGRFNGMGWLVGGAMAWSAGWRWWGRREKKSRKARLIKNRMGSWPSITKKYSEMLLWKMIITAHMCVSECGGRLSYFLINWVKISIRQHLSLSPADWWVLLFIKSLIWRCVRCVWWRAGNLDMSALSRHVLDTFRIHFNSFVVCFAWKPMMTELQFLSICVDWKLSQVKIAHIRRAA